MGISDGSSGMGGGDSRASGARRRLTLLMGAVFLLVLVLITIGNAESMITDFAAAGVRETPAHIWIWQSTSVFAWLCVAGLIWWTVAQVRPPRARWPAIAALFLIGLPFASALHIALMIGLRSVAYALEGASYRFEGGIENPYLYEFRKDIPTYLQFVSLAALCQWLLRRVGSSPVAPELTPDPYLTVSDGAITHQVPINEIVQLTAAGNYVEIEAGSRTLLNRATLAAMESELGGRFVRHRSRLVNRDVIRRIETNQSGDFVVVLANGRSVKGSRRYRARVGQRL